MPSQLEIIVMNAKPKICESYAKTIRVHVSHLISKKCIFLQVLKLIKQKKNV